MQGGERERERLMRFGSPLGLGTKFPSRPCCDPEMGEEALLEGWKKEGIRRPEAKREKEGFLGAGV